MKKIVVFIALLIGGIGTSHGEGCHVDGVETDSPAARAGLKAGDVITAAGGQTIQTHSDLTSAVSAAGADLPLVVQRGEKTETITATLPAPGTKGPRLGVQCSYPDVRSASPVQTRFVPESSLSLGAGGVFPMAKLDTEFFGAGEQAVGSPGFGVSAQYLYATQPRWDIGLEVAYSDPGKNNFAMGPLDSDLSMRSAVIMALMRIHSVRSSDWLPYILLGFGVHNSQLEWNVKPAPGMAWTSGDPDETRSLVSKKKTSAAFALGVGAEFDFSSNVFLAVEGRADVLGRSKYEATNFGNSLGLQSVDIGAVNGTFQLRLGMRFGPSAENKGQPSDTTSMDPSVM